MDAVGRSKLNPNRGKKNILLKTYPKTYFEKILFSSSFFISLLPTLEKCPEFYCFSQDN